MSGQRTDVLRRCIHLALGAALLLPLAPMASASEGTVPRSRVSGTALAVGPVHIIDRETIDRSGHAFLGELLQELPMAGSALNSRFNGGGNGETYLDLRNLGVNRLLILLDGRRLAANAGGAVDLNRIPLAIVERIEILPGSAGVGSGSNAISGVVNLVTGGADGLLANVRYGQFDDTSDGELVTYDLTYGSAGERRSTYLAASYQRAEPVMAGDRSISAETVFGAGRAFGSSATPQGRFGGFGLGSFALTTDPGTDVTGPNGLGAAAFRPGDFSAGRPGSGTDRYDPAPEAYLQTPQERISLFGEFRYEFENGANLDATALFGQRESAQQLAPPILVLGLFGTGPGADIGVAVDNRYNPFGVELSGSSWLLARRLVEAGRRVFRQEVDSYRFGVGLDGEFDVGGRSMAWEVGTTYEEIDRDGVSSGLYNYERIGRALSGQPCRDDLFGDGCVELDVFGGQGPDGTGTITASMLDYIMVTGRDTSSDELWLIDAAVSGEVLDLDAGAVTLAAGVAHRREESRSVQDALVRSGVTNAVPRDPWRGSLSVDELFVEAEVPLLADESDAGSLDLILGVRYADYDALPTNTSGLGALRWRPHPELSLRLRYAEGFRAPSINELFTPRIQSFVRVVDPCSDLLGLTTGDAASPDVVDGCLAQGVPGDGSYLSSVGVSTAITVGAEPELDHELAETIDLGFAWQPSALDGLELRADYYRIDLDGTIGAVSAQQVLDACTRDQVLCDRIERNPDGSLRDIRATLLNLGGSEVEGVDLAMGYGIESADLGTFRIRWDNAWQNVHDRSLPAWHDRAGDDASVLGRNSNDELISRWKSSLALGWQSGRWRAGWEVHHLRGATEDCFLSAEFGLCTDTGGEVPQRRLGSTTYHDVQLSYEWPTIDLRLVAGVRNVGDKGPPLSVSGAVSFNRADYRVPGRFPYLQLRFGD